ncbi:MAG TPA: hypothetical protein VMZ22_09950 [Acidimicrobiales bacterium]|nr:hypothetical protein [Acidimicrobiales bacterium]
MGLAVIRAWSRALKIALSTLAILTILCSGAARAATFSTTGTTALVSAADGAPGNDTSYSAAVSADGRYSAFSSWASNLVAGDGNTFRDVFVRDNVSGGIERVSLGVNGEGDFDSIAPALSNDGRYVAFQSYATNLVADNNAVDDIFVRDTATDTTTRVSVASDGTEADQESATPAISGDGRYVVFRSSATNLVAGDTNGVDDVFMHDTVSATTTRVSLGSSGGSSPAISGDGRHVAFASGGTVFVRDLIANTTTHVTTAASDNPSISADGRYIAYESRSQVWLYDAVNHTTVRVSNGGDTFAGAPAISGDGRYVAFYSAAEVFVRDTIANTTTRIAGASSYSPAVSGDGQYIAFESGDGNVYLHTRQASSGNTASANPCAAPTLVGTAANDTLTGTAQRDVIDGRGGADTIYGLDGDDVICGGYGNDTLNGGNGNDALYGGGGTWDRCNGGAGTDTAVTCESKTATP